MTMVSKGGGLATTTIREAAVLTTSYVAADAFDVENVDQIIIRARFTVGASSGCRIKVEFSDDGVTYDQEQYFEMDGDDASYSPLAHKLTASGNARIPIPVADNWCKISACAITLATSTLLEIKVTKANL